MTGLKANRKLRTIRELRLDCGCGCGSGEEKSHGGESVRVFPSAEWVWLHKMLDLELTKHDSITVSLKAL